MAPGLAQANDSQAWKNPNAIATAPDAPATITDKARRIYKQTAELLERMQLLDQRLWPTPEKAGEGEPDPNALPWILEAIERRLENANNLLDKINRGI